MTRTYTEAELPAVAHELLQEFPEARVFALAGELGTGKTQLVKALCTHWGVQARVTSPSFTLVQEYPSPLGPVYHLDLYRLTDTQQAWELGVEEMLNSDAYVCIEWPALLANRLPKGTVFVNLAHVSETTRRLTAHS